MNDIHTITDGYNLALKNNDGFFGYYPVEENVYYYVRQLETAINCPEISEIHNKYPERFHRFKTKIKPLVTKPRKQ